MLDVRKEFSGGGEDPCSIAWDDLGLEILKNLGLEEGKRVLMHKSAVLPRGNSIALNLFSPLLGPIFVPFLKFLSEMPDSKRSKNPYICMVLEKLLLIVYAMFHRRSSQIDVFHNRKCHPVYS